MSLDELVKKIHWSIENKEIEISGTKQKLVSPEYQIQGCSEAEIYEIMKLQEVSWIPDIYKAFLLVLGKTPIRLWSGSDYTFSRLKQMKQHAKELIKINNNPFRMAEDAFVFWGHQGYEYYYFLTEQHQEDPCVHFYTEVEYTHKTCNYTLSEFMKHFL